MAMVTEVVFKTSDLCLIQESPAEFLAFWQKYIDMIPEEFRNSARVELDAVSEWDSGYLEFKISYQRLETEEEARARAAHDETKAARTRRLEIEQLKMLQEKYGGEI